MCVCVCVYFTNINFIFSSHFSPSKMVCPDDIVYVYVCVYVTKNACIDR